jgi:hypothetical protein
MRLPTETPCNAANRTMTSTKGILLPLSYFLSVSIYITPHLKCHQHLLNSSHHNRTVNPQNQVNAKRIRATESLRKIYQHKRELPFQHNFRSFGFMRVVACKLRCQSDTIHANKYMRKQVYRTNVPIETGVQIKSKRVLEIKERVPTSSWNSRVPCLCDLRGLVFFSNVCYILSQLFVDDALFCILR